MRGEGRGEGSPVIRSGVNAIGPHSGDLSHERLYAAVSVFNGYGEMTSRSVIDEWDLLGSPIVLTHTVHIGLAYDAVARYMIDRDPEIADKDVVIPVVAETDDSLLSDGRAVGIAREDVYAALDAAKDGPVREGGVGAGTGTQFFDFKGGIGTASHTHAEHAYTATNQQERQLAANQESEGLTTSAEMLRRVGIEVRELSVGSTPTAGLALRGGITEMRPGTYIYGDANQVALGSQRLEDCALAVVATVVATPAPNRAVVDAGSKALSADLRVVGLNGYGIALGRDDLAVARLSEEHAVLTAPERNGLAIGDRLVIVPAHVCTAVNLHLTSLLVSATGVTRWTSTDGRGWR